MAVRAFQSAVSWLSREVACRLPKDSTENVSEAAEPPAEAPSIDVVFSEMQGRLVAMAALDGQLGENARFVLAAASLLVAGFGALPGISAKVSNGSHLGWVWVPSLLIYLYLAFAAIRGFRLRTYTSYPEPEGLRTHLIEEPTFTKRRLFAAMAAAYATNKRELDQKACWVQRSQDGLILLGAWLVIVHVVRALS